MGRDRAPLPGVITTPAANTIPCACTFLIARSLPPGPSGFWFFLIFPPPDKSNPLFLPSQQPGCCCWSFGEAAVPVPARQDPGGLADVSFLSGVHGPDNCPGRARGSLVRSGAGPGEHHCRLSRARRAGCTPATVPDWPRSQICWGQRYGVVCQSPAAPRSRRQRSIPSGTRAHPGQCRRRGRLSPGRWGREDLAARQLHPWISAAFHVVSSPPAPVPVLSAPLK